MTVLNIALAQIIDLLCGEHGTSFELFITLMYYCFSGFSFYSKYDETRLVITLEDLMIHPNKKIMKEAIHFGLENLTVGVIIVKDDEIIVKTGGKIFSKEFDPTGHSEIVAIRKACKKLHKNDLKGCWLYTTYEPCPMCMSAICWAKMEGIVYAASHKDRNKVWNWSIMIPAKEIVNKSEHKPKLVEEFMREEAKEILYK
jgi:tRNA(adenine34) deaminase